MKHKTKSSEARGHWPTPTRHGRDCLRSGHCWGSCDPHQDWTVSRLSALEPCTSESIKNRRISTLAPARSSHAAMAASTRRKSDPLQYHHNNLLSYSLLLCLFSVALGHLDLFLHVDLRAGLSPLVLAHLTKVHLHFGSLLQVHFDRVL